MNRKSTSLNRRSFVRSAAVAAAGTSAMSYALANASTGNAEFYINRNQDGGEINIVNFYQPFIESVIPEFTEETGIKVNQLGTTSANDEWWARLNSGEELDFLIGTLDWVQRAITADLLLPLDLEKIPNTENLVEEFRQLEAVTVDGSTYASPCMRVYYSLCYNTNEFSEAPTSWGVTWDEQYSGRMSLHDHAHARVGTTALYLDDDPLNPTKWDEITEKLIEQKPYVLKYWTDYQNGMEMFANEEVVVGQLTAGRTRMAMKDGAPINWTVPEEGCLTFLDNYVVPKSGKNPEGGMAFIDFLQRADIAAREMDMMNYDTVNEAARAELSEEMLATFEIPEGANLVLVTDLDSQIRARIDETWTEAKLM